MSNIGYIRVSTLEQNPARQEALMESLGVEKVFSDITSGKSKERPGLNAMLEYIRTGDIVFVESISRLARSTTDLLSIVDTFTQKGVEFKSHKENIDTSTPNGAFMLTLFGAMAQLERENSLIRQAEGIAIAKAEGKYKGRKRIEYDKELFAEEYRKWKNGDTAPKFIKKKLNMPETTFRRRVKEYEIEHGIRPAD